MDLRDWLERLNLDGYEFEAEFWRERDCDRDGVIVAVAARITDNYVTKKWLERRLEKLGYAGVANLLRTSVLPPAGNTRTGDFGEILSTFLLTRSYGFKVPVLRLRYKDSPSGTQRLIDVLAFKFRRPPSRTAVRVTEVKTRTTSAPNIGADAVDQLHASVANLALSLSYIERRLTDEGRHWLADLVLSLLDDDADFELEEQAYIVTDRSALHPELLDRIDDEELGAPNLTMTLVLVTDLADLIATTYEEAASAF